MATPSTAPHPAIAEIASACLAVRVRMVARAVSGIYDRAMSDLGLTISQGNILVCVGSMGATEGCSPGKIGKILHMERSTVSRNLTRLLKDGLLRAEQGAGSGRVQRVNITPAGIRLIERALPAWRQAQAQTQEFLGGPGTDAVKTLGRRLMADTSSASRSGARSGRRGQPDPDPSS